MTGNPICPLCDGTQYKDHAGFAMDPCNHQAGGDQAPLDPLEQIIADVLASRSHGPVTAGEIAEAIRASTLDVEPTGKPYTLLGEVDFDLSPHDDPEFVAAWLTMEQRGYQWSEGNIEKAHFGWLMARATPPTTPALESGEPVPDFLTELRRVNGDRYVAWTGGTAEDPLYMSNEFGGEAGEVQNVVKKLVREQRGWVGSRSTVEALGDEIGDCIIYLDSVARAYGLDLAEVTAAKFNKTSDANGFKHRLDGRDPVIIP